MFLRLTCSPTPMKDPELTWMVTELGSESDCDMPIGVGETAGDAVMCLFRKLRDKGFLCPKTQEIKRWIS